MVRGPSTVRTCFFGGLPHRFRDFCVGFGCLRRSFGSRMGPKTPWGPLPPHPHHCVRPWAWATGMGPFTLSRSYGYDPIPWWTHVLFFPGQGHMQGTGDATNGCLCRSMEHVLYLCIALSVTVTPHMESLKVHTPYALHLTELQICCTGSYLLK